MARNKVAPEKNFHKPRDGWRGNRNSDRSNHNSDPFFASKIERPERQKNESSSGSFFVSKKQKTEILDQRSKLQDKNRNFNHSNKFKKADNTQGFFKNKSPGFDNKFKGGKVDKKSDKKPFDKKRWRLQTYSKKYKLEQWEDKRKKAVLREYYREIKDDQPTVDVKKIYEQYDSDNETENKTEIIDKPPKTENKRKNYVQNPNFIATDLNADEDNEDKIEIEETDKIQSTSKKLFKGKPKNIAYKKAKSEFQRIKEEKEANKEDFLKKKAEKEEALLEYKKKKTEKFKKLNKKTKRGQPIMKDRIEMLLEKIQSS